MTGDHIPDELLAEYSQGTLAEADVAKLEEHLLVCEECRLRLTEFDNAWGLNG